MTEEEKFKRVVKELLILGKLDGDAAANQLWQYHVESTSGKNEEVLNALQGLVSLKQYKDENGKDDFYNQMQPKQWERAFNAIKKYTKSPVDEAIREYAPEERNIVRENLMNIKHYTPYCGNISPARSPKGCNNPRTRFNGKQFECPNCGWVSLFPEDFINRYKTKWGK